MKSTLAAVALSLAFTAISSAGPGNEYTQTNLTSDLPGVAPVQDPNLVNPWGLVALPGGPFWTSNNGTGTSTLYDGKGTKLPLVVTLPGGSSGTASPTGIVGNASSNFGGNVFLFDTESGTINGWKPGSTTAPILATGAAGSAYKGLASGANASGSLLYAANFTLGRIDVFDTTLHATTTTGNFTDPTLPAGYSPFNIENIGGQLIVTYAKTGSGINETDGAGLGFVDVFDLNGAFVKRLASQGTLDAPWGVALAPAQFGAFGGDLIVGNFGDGTLNAYDPVTGTFAGQLDDANGKPVSIEGLWGLSFGNGAHSQDPNTLYFNAGIAGTGNVEDHGLFGSLTATPEPGSLAAAGIGLAFLGIAALRRRQRQN